MLVLQKNIDEIVIHPFNVISAKAGIQVVLCGFRLQPSLPKTWHEGRLLMPDWRILDRGE